jgi:hypothetical protein
MSSSEPFIATLTNQSFGNLVYHVAQTSMNSLGDRCIDVPTDRYNALHQTIMHPIEKALEKQDAIPMDEKQQRFLVAEVTDALHAQHFEVTKETVSKGFDAFKVDQQRLQSDVRNQNITEEIQLLNLSSGQAPLPTTEQQGEVDALLSKLRIQKQ